MEITIADNIITVLNYIFNKFGIVADWTAETVLPYISQAIERYVTWQLQWNYFGLYAGIFLLALGIATIIFGMRFAEKTTNDGVGFLVIFGALLIVVVSVGLIPICISHIVKLNNFPEIAFIEWVATLAK